MPNKKSAGLLLFRQTSGGLEVLLAHMGGPYWEKKDEGSWSIPKGEFDESEDPLAAAKREFEEETGTVPVGDFIPLEPLKQPSGKLIYAWALKAEFDPATLRCNMFSMEWPPKSGRQQEFPEIDRAEWLTPEVAKRKILKGQAPFVDQLQKILGVADSGQNGDRAAARFSNDRATAAQASLFES
ncbi:MAG TPA: NUDIX domain-containing protein [Pyrinomonadaceae bacterium]|nr:NUDIX domain-containing protein [Pyrinomonadaceae bacterium]